MSRVEVLKGDLETGLKRLAFVNFLGTKYFASIGLIKRLSPYIYINQNNYTITILSLKEIK